MLGFGKFNISIQPDTGSSKGVMEDYKLPEDRKAAEPRVAAQQQVPSAVINATPNYRHKDHIDHFFGM